MTQEQKLEYSPDFKDRLVPICSSHTDFTERYFQEMLLDVSCSILKKFHKTSNKLSKSNKCLAELVIGWRYLFSDEQSYIDFCNLIMEEVKKRLPNNIRASFNRQQSIKLEKIIPPGPDDLIRLA